MYKIIVCIYLLIFISFNGVCQKISKYKNSCLVNNLIGDFTDQGFISINDSLILANYNDSCIILNLSTCSIVSKLNIQILSPREGDRSWPNSTDYNYVETPFFNDNGKIYFRATINKQSWFCVLSQSLNLTKICRIETNKFLIKKLNQKFYVIVGSGKFYNNGSNVPTDIPSGIIVFNEMGYLLNSQKIVRIGGIGEEEIFFPTLLIKNNNLYIGTKAGDVYYSIGGTKDISYGGSRMNCNVNGNTASPYVILKVDTNLILKANYKFVGYVKNMIIKNDSICVQGATSNLYLPNIGQITNSVNGTFHFNFTINDNLTSVSNICTITGSNGCNFPWSYSNIDSSGFAYIPYMGTLFADKPYTSAGGENFLIGTYNYRTCEPTKVTNFVCQNGIGGTFSYGTNNIVLAISNSKDFFAGNTRYQGIGVFYFVVNKNGIQNLDSISQHKSSINSNNLSTKFSIFPNPASSNFKISIDNFHSNNNYLLKINNSYGQLIHESNLSQIQTSIDIGNKLDEGVYFITIIDSNNSITSVKKIIISN